MVQPVQESGGVPRWVESPIQDNCRIQKSPLGSNTVNSCLVVFFFQISFLISFRFPTVT